MPKNGNRNGSRKSALADPFRLAPVQDGTSAIEVIIETPKGSRNKYEYDRDLKVFQLKRVLPAGMTFPYDFGFIPSTRADDGDPVDVLVLMDEPAFVGCLLHCRLIGVIEGRQGRKKDHLRNDRLIAIERENHSFAHVNHVKELGKKFVKELEEFFVNYHELQGKKFRILDVRGPAEARRCVEGGIEARHHRRG